MTFDPYAPPAQQQVPPPYGPGAPYGYPPPPPRKSRTGWIVAGSVAAFFLVPALVVLSIYSLGRVVRNSEMARTGVMDAGGPSADVDLPAGWESEPMSEAPFRLRLRSSNETIRIGYVASYQRVPLDAALDFALVEAGLTGLERDGAPRSRTVAGADATMLRLKAPGYLQPNTWVVVFYGEDARWIVVYTGPYEDVIEEPAALGHVLGSWRW